MALNYSQFVVNREVLGKELIKETKRIQESEDRIQNKVFAFGSVE
jgi:hypothetical protein